MTTGLTQSGGSVRSGAQVAARELFRARFQRSLRSCVRRRFSVAECFGVVWEETLQEITLGEQEQSELYDELIRWAKHSLFTGVVHAYSPTLFTGEPVDFGPGPDGRVQAATA